MNWAMFQEIAAPYTQQELYELWRNFKEDPHSDQILADFMEKPRAEAAALIDEFECRYPKEHCYEKNGGNF